MSDELRARPAPAEPGASLKTAKPRGRRSPPTITAARAEILAELDQKAAASDRYRDWPEQVPGVPIGFLPGYAGPLCYDLDTHRLVIGKTGGGKATAGISYMLLHDDGHAVVLVDPKNGTVARATAGYRQSIGPVHIIDPYNMTGFFTQTSCDRYNPLAVLDPRSPTLIEDAASLASALCYMPNDGGDDHAFWDRAARQFTTALILYLVTTPGETADLLRLWEIVSLPGDIFLKDIVQPMQRSTAYGGAVARHGNGMARHALSAHKSFEEVFVTIRTYIPWVEFKQLRAATARTTFDFGAVREQGGSVYIVLDDEHLEVCASWVRLMLQSARLGLKRSKSMRPVHFIIDETAAFGRLELITTGLRAWREAKIRLHLFYQDIAQIKSAFRDGWSSIANTDVLQFMGCNAGDIETAEHISKILGERDMIVPTVGDGTSSTTGANESQARGRSTTNTVGSSTTRSDSVTRTDGSSWSTTTGFSSTVGVSHSTTTGRSSGWTGNRHNSSGSTSTTHGGSESLSRSQSNTLGGSQSQARGESVGQGDSRSSATGSSETETRGTSRSEGTSTNRSFTLQLRRSMRPEQVRMLADDQMIVIAGNQEPALVHKEHFFRNPRLVARALLSYDPSRPGPVPRPAEPRPAEPPTFSGTGKASFMSNLISVVLPKGRD